MGTKTKTINSAEVDRLIVRCPATGYGVRTTIPLDKEQLRECWGETINFSCPRCGDTHEFIVRDAYIEQALARPFADHALSR